MYAIRSYYDVDVPFQRARAPVFWAAAPFPAFSPGGGEVPAGQAAEHEPAAAAQRFRPL